MDKPKHIFILDGVSTGKNEFNNQIKGKGIWTWNINPMNFLARLSYSFGWNGIKDDKFYEFSNKLLELVEEYWGFKTFYNDKLIDKFLEKPLVQALILHGTTEIERKRLKEKHGDIITNMVIEESGTKDDSIRDIRIVVDDDMINNINKLIVGIYE